jgi:cytochrome c556
MYRKLIVAFAVLLLGVTTAAAQSCPEFIKKRQTLMKKSGAEAKIGTQMIKGERPFDAFGSSANRRGIGGESLAITCNGNQAGKTLER